MNTRRSHLFFAFLFGFSFLTGLSPMYAQPSCDVNEACISAEPLPFLESDFGFVCMEGCNINTSPDIIDSYCVGGEVPTVWYSVLTDAKANVLNVFVDAHDDQLLVFMVFKELAGCGQLVPVPITPSGLYCAFGINGSAEGMGTDIVPLSRYYIVVGSVFGTTGHFRLCVSMSSSAKNCVTESEVVITHRSKGGPLEGPFYVDETIGVCFNVYNFTGSGNNCQWFQGLVPVFGDGWDPSSFDGFGQPVIATLNGRPIGEIGNGLYGASTWDWFNDVGYHHDHPFFQVSDLDNNGTLDMCHSQYDMHCPHIGGLEGGCCPPCWDDSGDLLPPGWFAYGINGTCGLPGPPIAVDWGDGNSCGPNMGPWSFCFELKTRSLLDCQSDPDMKNLSLGFITFADGEVGAWVGGPSVCGLDQPLRLSLPFVCAEPIALPLVQIDDLCGADSLIFLIEEPGVDFWTWTITRPDGSRSLPVMVNNGDTIRQKLEPVNAPSEVALEFIGRLSLSFNTVVKNVHLTVWPEIEINMVETIEVCRNSTEQLLLGPGSVDGGHPPYAYYWLPGGETTDHLILDPPTTGTQFELQISDQNGCTSVAQTEIKVVGCIGQVPESEGKPLPTPTHGPAPTEDGDPGGHGFRANPVAYKPSGSFMKIFPIPASETIYVEWPNRLGTARQLVVTNLDGAVMAETVIRPGDNPRREMYVANWPAGVYIMALYTEDGVHTTRVIKQ